MKAMILAAGRGKRMGQLTENCPKPLLKVQNKALIVWNIEKIKEAGISEIIINTAYLGQHIVDELGDGSAFGVNIQYSREELMGYLDGLETAGGIIQALPLLGNEPFLLINADVWCDIHLKTFIEQFQKKALFIPNLEGFLLFIANPSWKEKGDFSLFNEQIILGTDYTFAGISILNPILFQNLRVSFLALAPILRQAIDRQTLWGTVYSGDWQDVGTPERLAQLNQALLGSQF